jgi:hypothetical protein
MSVITYWWGLEVAMPPPTLKYLASATSISHAIVNFLTALSIMNNGVREILPFVRYISQFIDFEWSAIKAQDKGKGVVCAATWLMPAAMVPRPWDFPERPVEGKEKAKTKTKTRGEGAGERETGEGIDLLDIISPPNPPPVLPTVVVTPPTVKGSSGEDTAPADVTTESADVPNTSVEENAPSPGYTEAHEGAPAKKSDEAVLTKPANDTDEVFVTANSSTVSIGEDVSEAVSVLTSSVTAPSNQVQV